MKTARGFKYVMSALLVLPLPLLAQVPGSALPTNAAGQSMSDTPTRPAGQGTPGVANSAPSIQDSSNNASVSNDTQLAKDKMFVRKASEGGFAEIQLGQLAAQKADSDDVKKLGQKMADDHALLNTEMKPVADDLGVRPADKMNKLAQDEYNKLTALSGTDFDKEYLAYMLKDHRKDLHDFRTEEAQTNFPELKDAAFDGAKLIAGHLYMVNKLAVANGVPSAYKASAPPAAPPK